MYVIVFCSSVIIFSSALDDHITKGFLQADCVFSILYSPRR